MPALTLGPPEPNPALDRFMETEGYEPRQRLYSPVTACWCGSPDLAPLPLSPTGDAKRAHYQLCTACGCVILRHVLPEEGLAELYGARYFREHQRAIGLPSFEQRYESDANDRIPVWLRALADLAPPRARVLEIGSSHGRFLKEMAAAGYDVLGLELDAEIAAWARARTGLDVRCDRIEHLDADPFDAVIANDVLEHVYDPSAMTAAAARLLAPRGRALFQTVVFDTPRDCPESQMRPLYHTILYSRASLPRLQSPGLALEATRPTLFGCELVILRRDPPPVVPRP